MSPSAPEIFEKFIQLLMVMFKLVSFDSEFPGGLSNLSQGDVQKTGGSTLHIFPVHHGIYG